MRTFRIVDSLILLHLDDGRTVKLDLPDGAWADFERSDADAPWFVDQWDQGPRRWEPPRVDYRFILTFGAGTLTIYEETPSAPPPGAFDNPFEER